MLAFSVNAIPMVPGPPIAGYVKAYESELAAAAAKEVAEQHRTAFTDGGFADFLASCGFRVIHKEPRFMPFSMKSSLG